MAPPARTLFPHRHNEDGTYQSICVACHATVAVAQNEQDLRPRESAHVCDPIRLYQVSEGGLRLPGKAK